MKKVRGKEMEGNELRCQLSYKPTQESRSSRILDPLLYLSWTPVHPQPKQLSINK